jgi:RNA polymerase sigma-70 factor, ECF subfamily
MTTVETDRQALEDALLGLRPDLTGYCYRMLGSVFDAEDAVQETMVRAWRALDRFEGRSTLRSWLYRIATNVCFDHLEGRGRRALPMDLGPAAERPDPAAAPLAESAWVQPMPDARVLPADGDPADAAVARDSVRLAFVAALQHLSARQRAVLILRDVLRWQATEVADLLDTTPTSVHSLLQRARSSLAARDLGAPAPPMDDEQRALLARYVDAFERYDVSALVSLLHEDATFTMPPMTFWLRGATAIDGWLRGQGSDCAGARAVPTNANGTFAMGTYRPAASGGYHPFAIQVVELAGDRIAALHTFIDAGLFPVFGLPARLD